MTRHIYHKGRLTIMWGSLETRGTLTPLLYLLIKSSYWLYPLARIRWLIIQGADCRYKLNRLTIWRLALAPKTTASLRRLPVSPGNSDPFIQHIQSSMLSQVRCGYCHKRGHCKIEWGCVGISPVYLLFFCSVVILFLVSLLDWLTSVACDTPLYALVRGKWGYANLAMQQIHLLCLGSALQNFTPFRWMTLYDRRSWADAE